MSAGPHLDSSRSVRWLRIATLVLGIAVGVALLGFGGTVVLANMNAQTALTEAAQLQTESDDIRKVLAEAKEKPAEDSSVATQSKAVTEFQQNISGIAKAAGCRLNEFTASTDAQPYLCRFVKQSQVEGWLQVEIQLVLIGPSQSVLAAIEKLPDQSVPVEFSSLQIAREKIGVQHAIVKAKVQLRILVKTPGANP